MDSTTTIVIVACIVAAIVIYMLIQSLCKEINELKDQLSCFMAKTDQSIKQVSFAFHTLQSRTDDVKPVQNMPTIETKLPTNESEVNNMPNNNDPYEDEVLSERSDIPEYNGSDKSKEQVAIIDKSSEDDSPQKEDNNSIKEYNSDKDTDPNKDIQSYQAKSMSKKKEKNKKKEMNQISKTLDIETEKAPDLHPQNVNNSKSKNKKSLNESKKKSPDNESSDESSEESSEESNESSSEESSDEDSKQAANPPKKRGRPRGSGLQGKQPTSKNNQKNAKGNNRQGIKSQKRNNKK